MASEEGASGVLIDTGLVGKEVLINIKGSLAKKSDSKEGRRHEGESRAPQRDRSS